MGKMRGNWTFRLQFGHFAYETFRLLPGQAQCFPFEAID